MVERQFDTLGERLSALGPRRGFLGLLTGVAGGALTRLAELVWARPGERKRQRQRRRARRRRRPGNALYPDLQTLPPTELRFDDLSNGTHVLRFTNTVWNAGQGRLELEAPTTAGDGEERIYQNLYDAPVGGHRVGRRRVNGEIIYHPTHEHYHFADFASYQLLRKDDAGAYQPIGDATKTSFCITDNAQLERGYPRQYDRCEQERQGLTPGWRDTYRYFLDEQWVVLQDWPLEAGRDYGLQSIADPLGLLDEGGGDREDNNAAITYFTVDDAGEIQHVRDTP